MIFTINLATEPLQQNKFANLRNDLSLLQNFFQEKQYGSSVNEVAGILVCTTPFQLKFVGLGIEYSKRKKLVSFLTKIDLDWVEQNEEPLVRQKCRNILMETFEEFEQQNIKDFNVKSLVEDFQEYLQIMETNNDEQILSKIPELSDQMIKVQKEKWERFLSK